jgi:hypothetical protein
VFTVTDVSDWDTADEIEAVGTRPKAWLRDPDESLWLFKEARSDAPRIVGQDWAEKAAAELAKLLEIPAATVELASRLGTRGIVSRNFVNAGSSLVHGNELLSAKDPSYPQDQRVNDTAGYTVEAIRDALGPYASPEGLEIPAAASAFDGFSGFLVFDAWINNTDRHHMNWGVLDPHNALAPSFDHGSSLAFGETDERRANLLSGGDALIRRWLDRGRTKSFEGMPSMVGVAVASLRLCSAPNRTLWLERMENLNDTGVRAIIDQLPATGPAGPILSQDSRTLCKEILRINRERLLDAASTH